MCTESRTRYDTALASGDPNRISEAAHAYAATDQGDTHFATLAADAYDNGDDTEWVRLNAIRDQGRALRHHHPTITLTLTATRTKTPTQPVFDRVAGAPARKHHFGFPNLRTPHYG